jgi:hypothetical protein
MSDDTITNDDRLEVLKDITREILNVTSYLSDDELNEKYTLVEPTDGVDQSIHVDTDKQLDYHTHIHDLSVNVEWLGRSVKGNKE